MNFIETQLKVERGQVGLLKTLYFSFGASGLMSIMLGTLLPYIRDENALSYTQSGLILSAHQFGNLCAVLVAGILPYLIGRKKSTLIMGAGTALGLVLMTLTHSVWGFVLAFSLTGIGRGTLSNICNVVIATISGNKTGALNMLHACFAVGALLSPVIVALAVLPGAPYWKLAALFAAALAGLAWLFIACSSLSNTPSPRERDNSLAFFLKDLLFWVNTLILFCYLCAEASIIGWFVIYFQDTGILSPALAQFTPTLLWIMVMAGRMSCAAISARVDKNKLLLVLAVCFAACFTGLLLSRTTPSCVIFLLGVGASMAGIYPTNVSTMSATSSTAATGFFISAAGVGGILMPGLVGRISDSYGVYGGVCAILVALVCMIALIVWKLILVGRQATKKGAV